MQKKRDVAKQELPKQGLPVSQGMPKQDLPVLSFDGPQAFETWLAAEPATSRGLWLKIAKKGAATPTVSYAEALELALCHGWIDGQKAPLDAAFWLQRFVPRRKASKWSKINCDKAEALIKAKRMKPAGKAAVEAAKRDGRWAAAYESQSKAEMPDDLKAALERNAAAAAFFATLDRHNRYAILYRLHSAKKPETRLRRLAQFVEMLERQEKIHPS
jgi:uncharacterized protein YdeI (YjbR/CyaY-like superfamily)